MLYFSFYLMVFFLFWNTILGKPRKRIPIPSDLIIRLSKKNKNKTKKALAIRKTVPVNYPINNSENKIQVIDNSLSDIISCFLLPKIKYGHIFVYMYDFLEEILRDNKVANQIIRGDLLSDIHIFLRLLKQLTSGSQSINRNQIKKNITEKDIGLREMFFSSQGVSFFEKNSYVMNVSFDLLQELARFFEENNIKDILKKRQLNEKLDNNEEVLLSYYHLRNSMIKKNILRANQNLKYTYAIAIKKIDTPIIKKDIAEYLNFLAQEIESEEGMLFNTATCVYLYYLLLNAKIISSDVFKNNIIKTVLDKADIPKSFQKINEALKASETLISDLWNVISKNKELFINSNEYIYIEKIDEVGGMSEYLKRYILQKNTALKQNKSYLPAILKVVGTALVLAGGIYATNKILGGDIIKKGGEVISGLFTKAKDKIFGWFKEKQSSEIAYQVSTTNLLDRGLVGGGQGIVNMMTQKVQGLLPAWCQTGTGAFFSGLGILALQQEANGLISEKILQPIAKTLGFNGIDVNFSLYKYARNKIVNFFSTIILYNQYDMPGDIVNESAMIEEFLAYQKQLRVIVASLHDNKTKYIKKFESLVLYKLKDDIANIEHERYRTAIFNEGMKHNIKA